MQSDSNAHPDEHPFGAEPAPREPARRGPTPLEPLSAVPGNRPTAEPDLGALVRDDAPPPPVQTPRAPVPARTEPSLEALVAPTPHVRERTAPAPMGIDLDAVPAEVAFTDTPAAALPGEPSHDAPHPLDDTIVGAAHELSPMASAVGVPEPVVSPLGDLELDEEIVLPGEGFDHASPPPALTSSSFSPRHQLEAWLAAMVQSRASDLILRAGGKPSCRVDGKIRFLPGRVPAAGALLEVLDGVVGLERMELWRESGSVDVAVHLDGLGRFRLNAYKQMGEPAVVLRRISDSPPLMENLGLPTSELKRLAGKKRGIVLVTGIAGSGKSTTLAAIIQYMNLHFERHIVTLEDPVEMMFTEDRCVISQREVGTDCPTFHEGLRHALRQSPDVILIGEMRDAETVNAALDATETGHLVLSTLHTVNAAQTVDRILSFFPAEQHAQARARLAENLGAVLSQRLIPRATGKGLVPAFELMTSSPHVRELLVEGRTSEISRVIDTSGEPGLISFNMSLRKLVESAWVDLEIALSASDRPDELMMALRGFQHGSEKRGNQGPSDGPASSLRMAE